MSHVNALSVSSDTGRVRRHRWEYARRRHADQRARRTHPTEHLLSVQNPTSRRREVDALRAASCEPAEERTSRSVAGGRLASHDVKCGLAVANSRRERILRLQC